MTLYKFGVPPDQNGYTIQDGSEVVATKLGGGASRQRRDILGAAYTANVQWTLGPEGYRYFRAFYKHATTSGSTPFLIDLLLNSGNMEERECYFMPGSVGLIEQRGLKFVVGAKLEIKPKLNEFSDDDLPFIILYGELGQGWESEFPMVEDEFNTEVNQTIPSII